MWRSFFFALGASLMLLGAEALIFERFVIAPTARLPKFFDGLFENGTPSNFAQGDSGQISPFSANPQLSNGNGQDFRLPSYSQSSFGPSRFSGPQNGNYGGGRVDLSRSGLNPQTNRNAGAAAFPASFENNSAIANNGQSNLSNAASRTIITKDWMPWSLLAAGAIIFLYTSSSHRRTE